MIQIHPDTVTSGNSGPACNNRRLRLHLLPDWFLFTLSPTLSRLSVLLLPLILMGGCNPYNQDGYVEYPVVEAYLVAERDMPPIHLATTLPADRQYSPETAAIRDAEVVVYRLDPEGEIIEPGIVYEMNESSPGLYLPLNHHIVQPGRSYRLEAVIPEHGVMRATTTIPATFRVISPIPETVIYQSARQLEFTISANVNPGRQNIYIFNAIAREVSEHNLTPFYREVFDDDDNIQDFQKNPSNLINEANFDKNPDGSIDLRFPWIGVAFFGKNQIVTNSIDPNITDFLRSQDVQLGGSTLSPGEIPNAIYRVENGIGVFGGVASDTITTIFVRPEGF